MGTKLCAAQSESCKVVLKLQEEYRKAVEQGHPALGGRLALIDLAGADHDNRDLKSSTKEELRESAQINKELFVLKNVMAGMGSGGAGRLPWRDSLLSKVLKRA